ncbi:WhiB family transcriptional regulator (plasmid) [Mycolicibacterium frederiksbergense]|uniref:Transcriptional regulator WhiB n=1 Tax=Mycolicibacterium frederiksbergense TaxID=117567 RepID=A0A6H0RZS6_9MYCO|nr:WhiB family transcriptional regulator [Mycolicibacterium frederiksbergense]
MSEAAVIELIATLGAPQPVDEDWAEKARCPETDPEAFFPEKGGSTKEAKKVCQRCPVKDPCLQWALDNDERFGVWGGLSERERRRLQRGLDPNRTTDGEIVEPQALPAIAASTEDYQDARLAG